jgi:hypothetical protein
MIMWGHPDVPFVRQMRTDAGKPFQGFNYFLFLASLERVYGF